MTSSCGPDDCAPASLAPANALAAWLLSADVTRAPVDGALDERVTLWLPSRGGLRPCEGRVAVIAALRGLALRGGPTRVRVLRQSPSAAVLSVFARDEALWSLEVAIARSQITAVMLRGHVGLFVVA